MTKTVSRKKRAADGDTLTPLMDRIALRMARAMLPEDDKERTGELPAPEEINAFKQLLAYVALKHKLEPPSDDSAEKGGFGGKLDALTGGADRGRGAANGTASPDW